MAIKLYKGKVKTEWLPVTTSTALAINTLVEMTSGLVGAADADDTALAGILMKTIASTDADYATARRVPIMVPMERHCIFEIDGTGTFAATDIGAEFGISDSGTLDKSETTAKCFLITEFISATKVRGYLKVNGSY